MKTIATISKIMNGFVLTNKETGEVYYLKNFEINKLMEANGQFPDHEKNIKDLVFSFPGQKISAIRAVREYCINNNYDKYRGLKDAKDYVESVRLSSGDLFFIPWENR